jgi:hypothetical protein
VGGAHAAACAGRASISKKARAFADEHGIEFARVRYDELAAYATAARDAA